MKKVIFFLVLKAVSFAAYAQMHSVNSISYGNFSLSSGAVYGQMGWESVKDIASDGSYIYILVSKPPSSYIIKYDQNGNVISTTTVGFNDNGDYSRIFISTSVGSDSGIFVTATLYTNPSKISIVKYSTDNLVMVSSSVFQSESSGLEFMAGVIDQTTMYACINLIDQGFRSAYLAKINLTDFSVSSYPFSSDYECGRDVFKKGTDLYTVLKSSDNVYISSASISSLYYQTIQPLNDIPPYSNVYFVANSSNIFAVFEDYSQSFPSPKKIIYKYDYSNFSGFISSSDIITEGSLQGVVADESNVFVLQSVINPINSVSDFRISLFDTSTLTQKNEYTPNLSDNSYPRKIVSIYSVSGSTAYITGETYICKSWGCDNDIRTIRFSNFDLSSNKPPILSFPSSYISTKGIEQGRVLILNQKATFYVEYYDMDGDATSYVKIHLKRPNDNNYTSYEMICSSNCIPSNRGPMLFSFSTTVEQSGEYKYKFSAQDSRGMDALGYPAEGEFGFSVLKGFEGSLGDANKTVKITFPFSEKEVAEYKIYSNGSDVYGLINPNVSRNSNGETQRVGAPSIIVKLSTSPETPSYFYDLNFDWPDMAEKKGWFVYDLSFNESGKIEVLASSQIVDGFQIFIATLNPVISNNKLSLDVLEIPRVISTSSLSGLPDSLKLNIKNGKRYITGGDGFAVCDLNDCNIYSVSDVLTEPEIKAMDVYGGYVYLAGSYDISSSTRSARSAFILKTDESFSSTTVFTLNGFGNTVSGEFKDIMIKDGNIYAVGEFKTLADNYGMILRLNSNLEVFDSKIINPGKRETFDFIKDAGDYILVSGSINRDDGLTSYLPFMIVMDSQTLDYVNIFKDLSDSNTSRLIDINLNGGSVYYITESYDPYSNLGTARFIKADDIIKDNRVDVSVNLKDTSANNLNNTAVDFIPIEEGRVDVGKSVLGLRTGNNGVLTAKLLKGVPYFIAISTQGYLPNTRQQFFDPYKRFIGVFSSPTTLSYTFSKSQENFYKYSVVVSSIIKGMQVFGSITYNNEAVSFSVSKATSSVITLDFYNLSSIEPDKYKLEISIPELLSYSTIMPSTMTFYLDFSSATTPGYSYEELKTEPLLRGIVVDSLTGNPIPNATVSISTYNCYSWPRISVATLNTDPQGRFLIYPQALPNDLNIICLDIKKQGYIGLTTEIDVANNPDQRFSLNPATYSLSGYLTYRGNPLSGFKISAGGYDQQEFKFRGTDSYCLPLDNNGYCTGEVSFITADTVSDSNGYFNITGLKDGNIALYNVGSFWRIINSGADNQPQTSDDIRIVISSAGAIPPSYPPDNICKPGKVWILSSDGMCMGIAPYTFDLMESLEENATLYLNIKYDVVGATDTSATILIQEECKEGKDCNNLKHIMIPLPDGLTSGATSYIVNLSSGMRYEFKLISDRWAKRSIFDSFDFRSTDTIHSDIVLARAGSLKIKVVKPDGSLFIPVCLVEKCKWPRFYITSSDGKFSYSGDFWVDSNNPNPVFEISNIVPGRYSVVFKANGYPLTTMDGLTVEAGKTTEVKLRINPGLVVKPNITSLPQTDYYYAVLAVPSGFEMKRKTINDLLFSDGSVERYVIDYDTTTSLFKSKYLDEARYDVYLVLASRYDPEGNSNNPSFRSFVNFIGVEKGRVIQRNPQDPSYGSESNPISDFNIYGSLGKATLTGKIRGKRIAVDKDFEKVFAQDLGYLISLIPSVMIYDETGNLRAYSHCIMDSSQSFNSFMSAIPARDTQTIISLFISSSTYFIPLLPTGRYTAVFLSPNYPPVSKEIVLSSTYTVFDLDFDKESFSKTKLIVKVFEEVQGSTRPVKGARISISHKAYENTVYTDDSGEYVFEDIPIGLYKMDVFKDGYVAEGKKFSLGNDELSYNVILKPSFGVIRGRVYLSKFPKTIVRSGVEVTAYNESRITEGSNYVPSIKVLTDDEGGYEIKGVERGSTYKIVVKYPGKLTQSLSVKVSTSNVYTYADDIVFIDVPPQIDVKLRRYKNTIEVYIKSPKEMSTPVCDYLKGKYTLNNFDETNATRLSLVLLPNNTYSARFNISMLADYYTIRVKAGDVNVIEKVVLYDVKNDISVENYITDQVYLGGSIYADSENDDYTGIELDAGSLTHSTYTAYGSSQGYGKAIRVLTAGGNELIGGFFSSLPTIRTTRTSKGDATVIDAIKSIMASDIYDINLSNVQPNREFTLILKYDKEKVIGNNSNLRIYQYDEQSGQWKEIKGTYTVDPMLGTVSVDVASISNAYESTDHNLLNPYVRKRLGMSAISGGRFVPQADIPSSQTGRFAVFIAKPPTGVSYPGASFEVYNIPNPFNLKSKTVNISEDGGSWYKGDYNTEGTIIKYHLPSGKSGHLRFVIYNIAGEMVRTLDEGYREGGYIYYSEWDGRNDKNNKVASGVYFLVTYLNGDKIGSIHKMAVIK